MPAAAQAAMAIATLKAPPVDNGSIGRGVIPMPGLGAPAPSVNDGGFAPDGAPEPTRNLKCGPYVVRRAGLPTQSGSASLRALILRPSSP